MMAAPYHRRPFHKKKSTRKHCQPSVAVADTNLPVKHGKVCNMLQTSRLLKNKKETMKYPNLQKFVRCKNGNGTQAVTFHAVPPRHWKNRICKLPEAQAHILIAIKTAYEQSGICTITCHAHALKSNNDFTQKTKHINCWVVWQISNL